MTQVDANLYSIKKDMKEIISDNWTDLALGNKNKTVSIAKYKFWEGLKESRSNQNLAALAYLKTTWDHSTVISYNNSIVSYEQSRRIQKYINKIDLNTLKNLSYKMIRIDNSTYLIINDNLYNYSFGYIIDVTSIIDPLEEVRTFDSEQIYISDTRGNIVNTDHPFSVDLTNQSQAIQGQKGKALLVTYPSKQMDYFVVRTVSMDDMNSELPFLEKILRIAGFVSILIVPLMWYMIRRLVLVPLHRLSSAMHEIEMDHLEYRIQAPEKTKDFQQINHMFNRMTEQIKQLTIASYEKDIEKLQIEATNMRLQVNPHMLLNSLNMIYNLSFSQNYKCIQEFTLCLTDYFRYVLHQKEELVTVRDEMKFVNSYLGIQKIRFPGSFVSVCNIEEKLFEEKVPPLLIQNFVENSIKYALKLGSEIEIIIIVKRRDSKLIISIVDTGNGMDHDTLDIIRRGEPVVNKTGEHIGIWNCRRRLKMYYGEDAKLNISSVLKEGTQVWIEIPIEKDREVSDESVNC
jgi:Putative regulator of cell autolysis